MLNIWSLVLKRGIVCLYPFSKRGSICFTLEGVMAAATAKESITLIFPNQSLCWLAAYHCQVVLFFCVILLYLGENKNRILKWPKSDAFSRGNQGSNKFFFGQNGGHSPPYAHAFIHSFIRSFIHSFIHSFMYFIHPFAYSSICLFTHSLIN